MLKLSYFKFSVSTIGARKYMRSISQAALHYRPEQIKPYTSEENLKDRVVQTFFDASMSYIRVTQSLHRLEEVTKKSTPAHSYYQICLPFSENKYLKKKMVNYYKDNIRTGRILQLMDYIAANVAYRYCLPKADQFVDVGSLGFIAVTAAIDQIDFYAPVQASIDCVLRGFVCYVGKSTMEVQIDVSQKVKGVDMMNCSAKFVMAARDKTTLKAYTVPCLDIQNEPERFSIIHQLGSQRQINRKNEGKKALQFTAPTYEQSSHVHDLMKSLQKVSKQKFTKISQTLQRKTMIMHLEDKNLSGKIFGGFILRLSYELSWLCAYRFLNSKYPVIAHIDDVQFLAPVEVGSIVDFKAAVTYVRQQSRLIHVIVSCENSKPSGELTITNILRLTYEYEEGLQVNKVYPQTLTQSYQFIQSMRRVNKFLGI